jgi:predicted glycosyltransferase
MSTGIQAPTRRLIAVMTCAANRERERAVRESWLSRPLPFGVEALFVLGGAEGDARLEGDRLVLPVPEAYEALPLKTQALCRWVVNRGGYSHVLKCDDDTYLHVEAFAALDLDHVDYAGRMTAPAPGIAGQWHFGKCSDKALEVEFAGPFPCRFAEGFGYVLSRRAAAWVAAAEDVEIRNHILEDIFVGCRIEAAPTPLSTLDLADRVLARRYALTQRSDALLRHPVAPEAMGRLQREAARQIGASALWQPASPSPLRGRVRMTGETGGKPKAQKRALFYVFDAGTGVGHLRRLSAIAERLQGRFACLVVTGHRAAANWFVPEGCEYLRLPSWDGLIERRAGYWGRAPFLSAEREDALRLRREILKGAVRGFRPDAIFVDHLPLGAEEELAPILKAHPARKYLVTRGVLNETEDLRRLILGGRAHVFLKEHYHRILAATDPRVFDFSRQYNVDPSIRDKVVHTGYVAREIPIERIAEARAERGLAPEDLWVVASAGGGQAGEGLIEACIALAGQMPDIAFDIVAGPRSRLAWPDPLRETIVRGRMRLHRQTAQMQYLNAGADLVITSGGYNTLMETLRGNAHVLCFPIRKEHRDEQYQHALHLRKFMRLDVSTDLADLPGFFAAAVERLRRGECDDHRRKIDTAGAAAIECIVSRDLGLESDA